MATFCYRCTDTECDETYEIDARFGMPPAQPRCKIHDYKMRRDYRAEGALVRTAWPTPARPYRVAQRPKAAIRAEDEKKRKAEVIADRPPVVGKTKILEVSHGAD